VANNIRTTERPGGPAARREREGEARVQAIDVANLAKSYGRVPALRGVSFDVAPGEFFGLLGPNGAGKSTLLNILAGLVRPTRGTARVHGHDVVRAFRTARRNLGVVPQELVIESFFSVRDVLRIQSGYFGVRHDEAWIDELLRRLHLWDQRDRSGRHLSGGMKRRLLMAKALVHRPAVILLDEPTAGVDVELRRDVWDFIREIHAAGTTVLLTTHYLAEAEENCDRLGILGDGRLLALERTRDLLARRLDRQVVVTLATPLAAAPPSFAAFTPELDGDGRRLRLFTRGPEDRERLWNLVRQELAVVDVDVTRPSLEDVFLELTNAGR
jgi:ABC-2 type transport system ATP-binding protein